MNLYSLFIFLIFLVFPIDLITTSNSIESSELKAENRKSLQLTDVEESFQKDLYLLGPGDVLRIKL